jgi:hypothetical protein
LRLRRGCKSTFLSPPPACPSPAPQILGDEVEAARAAAAAGERVPGQLGVMLEWRDHHGNL